MTKISSLYIIIFTGWGTETLSHIELVTGHRLIGHIEDTQTVALRVLTF